MTKHLEKSHQDWYEGQRSNWKLVKTDKEVTTDIKKLQRIVKKNIMNKYVPTNWQSG